MHKDDNAVPGTELRLATVANCFCLVMLPCDAATLLHAA
jgi:hypothetical protein